MNNLLDKKLKEIGFCCEWGWCSMVQPKVLRGLKRGSAKAVAAKYGVSERTVFHARRRFDNGASMCQGCDNCIKHARDKGQEIEITVSFPCTIKVADGGGSSKEVWLITFRDFAEIKETAPITHDKMMVAQLALVNAIEYRMSKLQNVPFPSRAWEGDRLIDVPSGIVAKMLDYKKFHMTREPKKFGV